MNFFVVDRIEGAVVVLVDDGGVEHERDLASLPPGLREGVVVRVPVISGRVEWADAARDLEEERRRRSELAARVERLRKGDPGGDVKL